MDLKAFLASAFVSPSIFTLRPDYRALLIAANNLPAAGPSTPSISAALSAAEIHIRTLLSSGGTPVTSLPHIAAWRNAYTSFNAKPNKPATPSEALTRPITPSSSAPQLPRINKLTDLYNAISARHQIPLGGEDLHKYVGSPRCIRATGEEFEIAVDGEGVKEKVEPGGVVWVEDVGVTCRGWNW